MSKALFTPLEKVHPVRCLSLTGQANKVGGKDINAVRKKFSNVVREDSLTGLTVSKILIISLTFIFIFSASDLLAIEKKAIVITSQTLIADNKNNIATFEGSVVAKNEDMIIYSDKMEVSYDNKQGKITKIRAYGNVKAHKNEHAIFSDEAIYSGEEEKIVFTGEPKAVEGENVITGTEIIYFLKENRTIVKGSRVVLKK